MVIAELHLTQQMLTVVALERFKVLQIVHHVTSTVLTSSFWRFGADSFL